MTSRRIPVACNLEQSEFGERRKEWLALGEDALLEKRNTETGLRLRFRPSAEKELVRLAAAERECCGFAEWTVSRADDGDLTLDVTAEGIGVAAVRAMFD
ncbi:MAG: hypothetical protein ACREA0_22400 [bacterium]